VVVADIVRNLLAVGMKPEQIYIYERFPDQMESVKYGKYLDQKVNIHAVEMSRGSILNYDPETFVEVNFFGEEDTRSNLVRLVSEKFTKIINVPNMKDHGAAGVTGCLKNIAYGNFSNVARSHAHEKTNTKTFIDQDKVFALCQAVGARTYVNAIGGTALYAKDAFRARGLDLAFVQSRPLQYAQFGQPFVPWLSIVDVLMFNSLDTVRGCVESDYDLI